MQVIDNGPYLPADLLESQEDGNLALFCGAGASKPAGLPLFSELVQQVYSLLGEQPEGLEREEVRQKRWDRVLTLLERRFDPALVREKVALALAPPPRADVTLHKALLELATSKNRQLRLVTTNFDTLFEAADPGVREASCSAPLLPVPKREKWSGLVHLHGCVNQPGRDYDRLVLSTADFGVAYLVERWASRFVTELFANFDVLFVGYSADDPVMRYLIDALAAERQRGQPVRSAYALAPSLPADFEDDTDTWNAKNVRPILYEKTGNHQILHDTIKVWAGLWRGGLQSKTNRATALSMRAPSTLSSADVSQMVWATASEATATALAGTRGTQLDWFRVFENAGMLTNLVRAGFETTSALGDVEYQLGRWLTNHLNQRELLTWVVEAGGHLHPGFAAQVRRRLTDHPNLASAARKVWMALTGTTQLLREDNAYDRLQLYNRVRTEPWTAQLRLEVLLALAPRLKLRPAWPVPAIDEGATAPEPLGPEIQEHESVAGLVQVDCEVASGSDIGPLVQDFRARQGFAQEVAGMAFDLTGLLRRALDMMSALDAASADYDPSVIEHPSIEPHEQNHGFRGWTTLIELVRESYVALLESDPPAASSLVRTWLAHPYPLFRRLVLYAVER